MAKNRFSEPEQFLIKNWADVLPFREAIESISIKYDAICQDVIDAVCKKCPELDRSRVFYEFHGDGRQVGIGKTTWPSQMDYYLSGFWISDISIESLVSEDQDHPAASIWLKPPAKVGFDYVNARARVLRKAKRLLPPSFLRNASEFHDQWTCLWYPLPETRQQLLAMLLKDQGGDLVKCFVSHFETLAKFAPEIDELFEARKPRRK